MANFLYVAILLEYTEEKNQLFTHLGPAAMGVLSKWMDELVIFYKVGTRIHTHTRKHKAAEVKSKAYE